MPASLRFGLGLLVAGFLAGAIALGLVAWQREARGRDMAEGATGGRVAAGRDAVTRRDCGACHEIPGLSDAKGRVGPPLGGFATRATVAGRLANRPAELTLWIRDPQAVNPGTGMPDLGIGEAEARDIASFLYTLD